MTYQHLWKNGNACDLPVGKVVCIGRNYADHAKELDNPIPDEPVLFIKPTSSIVGTHEPLLLPHRFGPIHYEAELSILIGETLNCATKSDARNAVLGIGVGLDLTRREVQSELKAKQLPWELAKAFDGSCVLSDFVSAEGVDLAISHYGLDINGESRQRGDTSLMLTPIIELISHISHFFTLHPGDVILTGTPKGVGVLANSDELAISLQGETLATVSCVAK
ncbi:isomerase/hydrolase [Veronia nyctiphanis]|uniref:Isomerase/hydrolase n=1 Tax=Veronia nyctiphanis TaxID=1278244 RepID=A0A4Q0YPJ0_9GAMM|nr:fumarylacetoacetate hydrolase family protein [Veronia nyctiphanis]RXJ71894.1 isomerase/hydrolase [Veronia nyctiphanis]